MGHSARCKASSHVEQTRKRQPHKPTPATAGVPTSGLTSCTAFCSTAAAWATSAGKLPAAGASAPPAAPSAAPAAASGCDAPGNTADMAAAEAAVASTGAGVMRLERGACCCCCCAGRPCCGCGPAALGPAGGSAAEGELPRTPPVAAGFLAAAAAIAARATTQPGRAWQRLFGHGWMQHSCSVQILRSSIAVASSLHDTRDNPQQHSASLPAASAALAVPAAPAPACAGAAAASDVAGEALRACVVRDSRQGCCCAGPQLARVCVACTAPIFPGVEAHSTAA